VGPSTVRVIGIVATVVVERRVGAVDGGRVVVATVVVVVDGRLSDVASAVGGGPDL
jgi:hypothetical protein